MPEIPASFSPLDERHFIAIAEHLGGGGGGGGGGGDETNPRFLALYLVSTGDVALHSGWNVRTTGTGYAALQACIRSALVHAAPGPFERSVVVIDRQEGRAWTTGIGNALNFVGRANPKPPAPKRVTAPRPFLPGPSDPAGPGGW